MKYSCFFFFSTSALFLVPFSKALDDLARKWNITDPDSDKDGNTFTFNYANIAADHITTIETQVQVTMYGSDCKVDGADTYGQMGIITSNPKPGEPFKLISLAYDNTGYDTTDGTGNIKYEWRMFPGHMDDLSDFDSLLSSTENIEVTEHSFCVRFGLYTGTEEVNFVESQVTVGYTLSFSFMMIDVSPKARDVENTRFSQTYSVVADLCPNQPDQFNQGAAIQVCLAPDGQALLNGVLILSVDSFIWERSGVMGASQSAVNEDEATDKNAEALDGLSLITVQDDQKQIMVTTILYAAFYASTGTVTASGSATINYSEVNDDEDEDEDEDGPDAIIRNRNRRLARDYNNNKQRNPQQQQQQQAFDINVDLNLADDGPFQIQTAGGTTFSTTTVGVGVAVTTAAATVGIVISTILFA